MARPFTWRDAIEGVNLLAGPANVVMQLAHPAVGYGVLESPVDSGKATLHPYKRARTTGTYLAVAALGTPEQQQAFRRAVNTVHAQVRSGPSSGEPYHALDPSLQLWVAACLYQGLVDTYTAFHGGLSDDEAERVYREAARLGTTLQVRPSMWPATRADFAQYWKQGLTELRMDEPVRRYLDDLVHLRHRPWPAQRLLGPMVAFFTAGFLAPEFRALLGWSWSDRQERRFRRALRVVAVVNRTLPGPVRRMPLNLYLVDLRLRLRFNRPLV